MYVCRIFNTFVFNITRDRDLHTYSEIAALGLDLKLNKESFDVLCNLVFSGKND